MPTSIDVTVALASKSDRRSISDRAEWRPSESGRRWRFSLSAIDEPVDHPEEIAAELLGVLSIVLVDASLLEHAVYRAALERAFERGLVNRLMFGRPFDELRMAFVDEELRRAIPATCQRPATTRLWDLTESPELAWIDGPGPGFSDELARGHARARCEKTGRRLSRQLAILNEDRGFQEVVTTLRGKGWRDHHILSSVTNIAINYRAVELGIDLRDAEAAQRLFTSPETEDSPFVPSSEFNVDAMERARQLALPAVLKTWNLVLHSPMPDMDALEKVLAERYGYWTADAPYDGDLLPSAP
jgi:hypothetical protein